MKANKKDVSVSRKKADRTEWIDTFNMSRALVGLPEEYITIDERINYAEPNAVNPIYFPEEIMDQDNRRPFEKMNSLSRPRYFVEIDGDPDGGDIDNGDQTQEFDMGNEYNSGRVVEMHNNLKRNGKFNRKMGRYVAEKEIIETSLGNQLYPLASQLLIDNIEMTKYKIDPQFGLTVDYPQFSLGFQHWTHASKNKTQIFDQFKGKKRVYQIVNGYERYIDDSSESLGNATAKFFEQKDRPDILSRAFYKLWEIFHYYDLISLSSGFRSAHLAEGPGSFIQATMFFREIYGKDWKNDNYYAVTIHSDDDEKVPELERKFVEYYEKEKPKRFMMHRTYDKQTAGGNPQKDNGDLTNTKTIRLFKKDVGQKVDLVTADGGFEWNNENVQEQESAILIYAQILTALHVQKKGGSFVLKMFECFTKMSCKFLILLQYFYETIDLVKPLTSRESNSERYIVCRKFKFEEKQISGILDQMGEALDVMQNKSGDLHLIDIFPQLEMSNQMIVQMIGINTQISNLQFKVINKMIEFIEASNFHGDLYQKYRERQIELSKHWINVFLKKGSYDEAKIKPIALIESSLKENRTFVKTIGELPSMGEKTKSVNEPKKKISRPKTNTKTKSGEIKKVTGIKKVTKDSVKKTVGKKKTSTIIRSDSKN